jgi:hypothetical protein
VNQAARRIGRTLAFVLPVVLVLSGTLAVVTVPWTQSASSDPQLLASSRDASTRSMPRTAQEVLRDRLLADVQQRDPGVALTHLQQAVTSRPSLTRYCMSIARDLGRAAVAKYGSMARAQRYSRPVCDTSFAGGVASSR